MATQRQLQSDPDPGRPPLRLVEDVETAGLEAAYEEAHGNFTQGLMWGLAVSALGFWLPVMTALWVWLR